MVHRDLSEIGSLSRDERERIDALCASLAAIPGVAAVVLGGSHARGRARPDSDVDLGVFYSEAAPFSLEDVRALARRVNDSPEPVVTGFFEWGPWVNGGAWLVVGGQRVDFVWRSLEHVERVLADAEAGRHELHFAQQPPFGFFSATYLGELAICVPLFDPEGRVARLKRRVAVYPEALRASVVDTYLWGAEFALAAFAPKFAARGDTWGTLACLTRVVHQLVLVLFALHSTYPLNDKTALDEIAGFARAPAGFGPRAKQALARAGTTPAELAAAVERVAELFRETVAASDGAYLPRMLPPKARPGPAGVP